MNKEKKEFLEQYFKDKIQRHKRLVEGYKIALKDIQEKSNEH